ncbi:MAG: AraC family transcriptional regulator [Spirochaetales bacterium]|uniref:AraC family transcriptional regulator n=1 Tax=Candidatus Thalassospirochaeta sargassi TaxID=3119039 RepID=A0AAJ1IHM3_9SPIO|nr:AraC family transcriptional regulator [Spirochaetales bacterium]
MDKKNLKESLENTADEFSNISLFDYKNFYYPPSEDPQIPVQVVHGNYNKCKPDYCIQRKDYPYSVLEYIISGDGYFEVNNERYDIRPGMIFGFSPGVPHCYGCSFEHQDGLEKITIAFHVFDNTNYPVEQLLNRAFHIKDPVKIQNLFAEIIHEGLNDSLYSRRIINRLIEVLILLLLESDFQVQPYPNSFHTFSKCKAIIDSMPSVTISMQDIASECGINSSYLVRLFKRYQDCTPKHYIDKLIVEEAVKLILESEKSIKEIAFQLGFTNQYYFSAFFKKHMHVSPSEIRKIG